MENINYAELALNIQEALNSLQTNYNFQIATQVGSYLYQPLKGRVYQANLPIISGVLVTEPSNLVPINQYNNYEVTCNLSIIVPKPYSKDIYELVTQYVLTNKGTSFTLDNYTVTVNFDMPTMGSLAIRAGAGDSLEIQAFVYYRLVSDGVISNDCIISIDGEEMIYFWAGVVNNVSLVTSNVNNNEFGTSYPESQVLAFSVKLPYRNTPKTIELVQEIFNKELTATHTLSYYDGLAFTEESPYTALFTAQNMQLNLEPQKIPVINITILLADTRL